MTVQDLPPNAVRRARIFCFATFRFAKPPRFELVYLTASLSSRRRRWLRIGVPGKISAQLLGLDDGPVANQNAAPVTAKTTSLQNLRGGLAVVPTPVRTAGQRPRYHREMEPRYDSCGGVFADWPDPGGAE